MRLTSGAASGRWKKSRARYLEAVESRLLLSATYTPAQIRSAYGIDHIAGNGAGQTIALVEAYADPYIASDVNTFDQAFSINGGAQSLYQQYGAAASFLTVTALNVRTRVDAGWSMETALDVEWAHVVAPAAKIAVVEANSSSISDLLKAIDYARNLTGVSVVSMSWGSNEFSGESAYDTYFTTPTGHTNITFVASSGDSGAGVSWPSVSPNVVSVGGTSLTINAADGSYSSESGWNGSGGGYSAYVSKPSYQNSVNSKGFRSNPDVAYNADQGTGYYVYDSNYNGATGWWAVGGTSAGAPQWAALVALADQARGTSLTTSQTLKTLYGLPAADFHDIVTGSNGFNAGAGYDLVTGIGTPIANLTVAGLASTTVAASSSDYSGTTSGGGGPGKGHGNSNISVGGNSGEAVTAVAMDVTVENGGNVSASAMKTIVVCVPTVASSPVNVIAGGIRVATPALVTIPEANVVPAQERAAGEVTVAVVSMSNPAEALMEIGSWTAGSAMAGDKPGTALVTQAENDTKVGSELAAAAGTLDTGVSARPSRWSLAAIAIPMMFWQTGVRKNRREENAEH